MKKIFFTVTILLMVTMKANSQWFLQYSDPDGYFLDIDFTSADNGWVAGLWKMIKTTDGGNSWDTLIQRPQSNTTIQAISFANNSIGWYIEQNGDDNHCTIYKTLNGGSDWFPQYTSPQFTLIWDMQFINQNNGFAVGLNPTFPVLWKTTDGGNTWNIITIDNVYAPLLRTLFFLDTWIGWAAGDGIYKTTDGGYSWNMLVGPYSEYIFDIQFTTSNIGWYSDLFGIKKTTDGGSTWIQQALGGDGWHTSSLYFIDSDTGYFCPFNGVLKTTDSGSSWEVQIQDYSLNLSDVCFVDPNNGWISGYSPGRIFNTNNGGIPVELISFTGNVIEGKVQLTWSTAAETNNQGFEILRFTQKDNNDWDKVGYIPGNGTTTEPQFYSFIDESLQPGKYQYRLKQIDFDGSFEYSNIIEVVIGTPTEFSLEQNFPNPFNPITRIHYQITQTSIVTLKVYDVLGNEVTTLVNEEKTSGSYEIEFSGNDLPSGVYFYQLQAGSFVETNKMVLIK